MFIFEFVFLDDILDRNIDQLDRETPRFVFQSVIHLSILTLFIYNHNLVILV